MIQVIVNTSEYDTSEPDQEDSWDRANTKTELESVSAIITTERIEINRRGWYGNDTFDVDANSGDIVYVVIARYSTGDTFGNDDGRVAVMDAFSNAEEAATLTEALECSERGKDEAVMNFELKHDGREYYLPWVGYFERLENVDVHAVRVS